MSPARDETARTGTSARVLPQLDSARLEQVLQIVHEATDKDGTTPLDEHVLLHLRHGGDAAARHVVVEEPPGTVVGYAHLDITDPVEGASAQLVVHPGHRGRGVAHTLVRELVDQSPDGRLRLWAHGGHPAAAALAESMGFRRHRSLWQLRRSLYSALPAAQLPPGITVRRFEPGADDASWVAVNQAAFADHPEQGSLTLDDLHRRMAEPWFDPAGFFLAERGDRLVGFHWTKVHGGLGAAGGPGDRDRVGEGPDHGHGLPGEPGHGHGLPGEPGHPHGIPGEADHGHEPIGEVYVVGIHPAEQGTGLGRALTVLGLRHLRSEGLGSVLLYVDESNTAAIRLYTSLGFSRWDVDVQYARQP